MPMRSFHSCLLLPIVISCCAVMAQPSSTPSRGRTYFVDCSARVPGNGSSPQTPWNSLAAVTAQTFTPGDIIRLRRGTQCEGALAPKGSGAPGAPIRLTAYGEGSRPKIIAGRSPEEALRLYNQQYWDIDSLDLSGGHTYGIFISGDQGILHHLYLSNLAVHDVYGGLLKHKESGLVTISPGSVNQHFDDVVVDDVTAWNTNQWVGIVVGGGNLGYPPESDWSSHAEIRNSMVHDVQGDGIVLFRVRHGRIDSSVAWNTGMQDTQTIGTPNAIWTWMCDDCTVQDNEAFLTDSPGVDGGAYDIDYGNTKNSVLDNYGHDTQGYCVAVFGAGFVTRQSTVRGNLCINNGRSPRMAKYQGAIFLLTWNGGSIDGLAIQDNTVYWNPYENAPALLNEATLARGTALFRDNRIYSTAPSMIESNESLSLAKNQYTYFGTGSPEWRFGAKRFSSLAEMQSSAHQENESRYRQLSLRNWMLAASSKFSGAGGSWRLQCTVPVSLNEQDLLDDAALRQLTTIKSIARQYQPENLKIMLILTAKDASLFRTSEFRNAWSDFGLDDRVLVRFRMSNNHGDIKIMLTAPDNKVTATWNGYAGPVQLGLALRRAIGEPDYASMGASK